MQPKMRRDLPGAFLTRELGEGAWRLSRTDPTPMDVFVRGADAAAAETLRSASVRDLEIEWREGAAALTFSSGGKPRAAGMQSAIVHEPLPSLYEALPLVILDAKATRFWRTVFRLIRIPGGRYLLGVLARRHPDSR
jgi:hypothetical protein